MKDDQKHCVSSIILCVVVVLTAGIFSVSCSRDVMETPPNAGQKVAPTASSDSRAPDHQSKDDLERLRALGYLDYTEEPEQMPGEGTMLWNKDETEIGYTLVVYAGACASDLITLDGKVIQTWSDHPCRRWEQAKLLPDGDLLVVGTHSSKEQPIIEQMEGRYLLRLSWDGEIRWRKRLKVHHDIEVTPQGSLLTLMMDRRVIEDIDPEVEVWDDILTLLDLNGTVLQTLSLYDVLASSTLQFPIEIAGLTEKDDEKYIDLFHCNGAEWMRHEHLVKRHPLYGRNNILITSRHQNAVMVINWETRELIWYWGQGELSGPHAATMQPDGNILIFDNGLKRRWSRVIEVDPLSGTIVREYTTPKKESFFSRVMGSCQRLGNGNVLIANSAAGQGLELTKEGQPAWAFLGTRRTASGHRVKIPRIQRIPTGKIEAILARVEQ